LAQLTKLISTLATKDDLKNLEKELSELKERVTEHDEAIAQLKELINNLGS
jgi:predicted  nucleic acid-binding Zn-ribbon protein